MKVFGKVLAALAVGVVSVVAVQLVIRRTYAVFGRQYYERNRP